MLFSALDPDEKPVYGPQYWDQREWDQDHFWKIPMAMANWIGWWATEAESDDRVRRPGNRVRSIKVKLKCPSCQLRNF